MDAWYEELVELGESFGLDRDTIDMYEDQYDRQLEPLQALIVTMHDAGLCSEDGDFGPDWQGISEHDRESMGCDDADEDCEAEEEDA